MICYCYIYMTRFSHKIFILCRALRALIKFPIPLLIFCIRICARNFFAYFLVQLTVVLKKQMVFFQSSDELGVCFLRHFAFFSDMQR